MPDTGVLCGVSCCVVVAAAPAAAAAEDALLELLELEELELVLLEEISGRTVPSAQLSPVE